MEDDPIVLDEQSTQHEDNNPSTSEEDVIKHDSDDLNGDDHDDDLEDDGDNSDDNPNDAKSEDEQSDDDESRKEHNRQAYEQRQTAKREAEQRNQQFLSSLRDKFMDRIEQVDESKYEDIAEEQGQEQADIQRRLDALEQAEQRQQASAALQQIESQRNFIGMNIAQAESKIPLFNPEDKENYNKDLHESVLADWASSSLETFVDQDGSVQILGLRQGAQSPEEYMREKAQVFGRVLQFQSAKAQSDAQRNKKVGESPSSAKATPGKVDASLKAFDEAFDSY